MFKLLWVMVLTPALLLPLSLRAEWTGGVEGGSVIRDGNTATRLRLRASLNDRPLSHYVYAEWIRSGSSSYEIGYKPRYWFTDTVYAFGDGSVRIDKPLQIDNETLLVGGLGTELINTAQQQAWVEAGLGVRATNYSTESGIDKAEEALGLVRGKVSQVLSDLFKLELDADITGSSSYLQSQAEVGVSMRLAQGAVKVSHRIRRVDIDGFESIDDSDSSIAFTVGF